ncbi:MAG: hypothetical protein OXE96_07315 [Gemmatimonadetes bacterium]|nr:hypothetical protein [Gemmatimonadota bacterium]
MNGRTLALALALVAPTPGLGPVMATAQNVGDQVRITVGEDRVVGRVVTIGQDSIHTTDRSLFGFTRFRTVAWESVDLLERRTGSRWLLGAAIGAGVLVGAGAIAVATREPSTGFRIAVVPPVAAFATVGIVGGLSGAVIGRLFSRWETVATDRAGAMTLSPIVDLRLGRQAIPGLSIGGHLRF